MYFLQILYLKDLCPAFPNIVKKIIFIRFRETDISPKTFLWLEFGAHILWLSSTDEYFETVEYELQTPTTNMFSDDGYFFDPKAFMQIP